MNAPMKKYPKIGQLKDVVYEVNRRLSYKGDDDEGNPIYGDPGPLPILNFEGTVKLHGTNACVVLNEDGSFGYQSRNRILTAESDNAGFVKWCQEREIEVMPADKQDKGFPLYIYGEFCGGNIQKGVGITDLDKMFVTFGTPIHGEGFYHIKAFQTWEKSIDFNNPELIQNELIEITQEVEKECPVAKHFGITGVGEGVVWKCTSPSWEGLMFKVKGEEHSKSKVKTLSEVDLARIEGINKISVQIMTPERLEQGMEYLKEMDIEPLQKNTGQYLKYVVQDALKEEELLISESEYDIKAIGKNCSKIAKDWYFKRIL